LVTKKALEKRIEKYKEELKKLSPEESREELRKFRKRVKRSQRKLVLVKKNEARLAGIHGKKEAGKKAEAAPEADQKGKEEAAGNKAEK